MKLRVAGIEFTVDDDDLQLAFVSHGEDERNPVFERSYLFATRNGDFYIVGGGGVLTSWRMQKGEVWGFGCRRMSLNPVVAMAWAGRFAPAAVYWVKMVIRQSEGGGLYRGELA
jgi:hypothetical protein